MSRKPIAILSHHPSIEAIDKEMDQLSAEWKEKTKQFKKEKEDAKKEIWGRLNQELEKLGLVTKDEKGDFPHMLIDDGVIYLCDCSSKECLPSLEELVEELRKKFQ